jgi:DNA-binding NtrC family response regulator/tetratricopeptide (TPR) repeat protein
MGRVLLVRDAHLGRDLALKLLHALAPAAGAVEEMQREFVLLAQIDHPGIARAHDFGYLRKRPYFTREYVPGETLGSNGTPPDGGMVLSLALATAAALAFLHGGGVLHLDIKPGNIILSPGPGGPRPILIDFGLCRRGFTAPLRSTLKGSLPYMAPEYFRGGPLGPWTDVYALGATLYRFATSAYPRGGPGMDPASLFEERAWAPSPRLPSQLCPGLRKDLDSIILRCLALDLRSRFTSARELLEALEHVPGGGTRSRPPSTSVETLGREEALLAADRFLDGLGGSPTSGSDPVKSPPAALVVTGLPGMGQSHLLKEIKVRAQTRGFQFYLETGYPGRATAPGQLLRCLGTHLDPRSRSRWTAFLARLRKPRRQLLEGTPEGERRLRWGAEVARALAGIRDRVILAIDGLQHFDEVSIALIVDLLRSLCAPGSGARPPVGLMVGYREAGSSVRLLRDLGRCLFDTEMASVISLPPLGPLETRQLYRRSGGEEQGADGLALYQETGGCPGKIVARARTSPPPAPLLPLAASAPPPPARPHPLTGTERQLLLVLTLLRRPAGALELARLAGLRRGRAGAGLERLEEAGLVVEEESDSGRTGLLPGTAAEASLRGVSAAERSRAEERLARALGSNARADEPRLIEAVEHFRRAGRPAEVVRHGLPAARSLKSTFQNRKSLEIYRWVQDALPRKGGGARIRVALEIAELDARLGEIDEGIQLLREVLPLARKSPGGWTSRVLLRLGTLHSRAGQFRRADVLFREGLSAAGRGGSRLGREERLLLLNEHAAAKAFLGQPAEALDLCRRGLRLARGARRPEIREAALNLVATRANVALRAFRFGEAARDFEAALERADAIGSLGTRSVILNNLALVYSLSDRHREAIRTFREAERTCLRLDEGPSLAFIYGNLAVLHARLGDFAPMEAALASAAQFTPREAARGHERSAPEPGNRLELFLEHHRGLCRLYRGRHREARPHFEAALERGAALGDNLIGAFDEVYRAECLIFEGVYAEADRALGRLAEPGVPQQARRLALARRAFLAAITGRPEAVERALEQHAGLKLPHPVPFLDAWDDLFLAWALSISGRSEGALGRLDSAEQYFRHADLRPAAALAAWVRAEALFLGGDPERAQEALRAERGSASDLTAALHPLLAARLLLEGEPGAAARARAADLLAEAGAAFIGNPLPEWLLRGEVLRASLVPGGREEAERILAGVEGERERLAAGLTQEDRQAFLQGTHWKKWTTGSDATALWRRSLPPGASPGNSAPERRGSRKDVAGKEGDPTAALPATGGLRTRLVAKSAGMRRLLATLDRLRAVDLPAVICGETGSGKELVARIIHAESRRSAAPFMVLDCSTLPPALLESELFGARAGAYSDLERDRPGLLSLATGGTVLIEGLAGAPAEVQAKLLRVIAEGKVRPLGSETELKIDVRFLFSAERDLEAEVRDGRLRRDLFHRMQVLSVPVPPLRERREDLAGLTSLFLREGGEMAPALGPGVLDRLGRLPWPGNVRELRNLLLRLRLENPARITVEGLALSPEPETTTLVPRKLLAREVLPALKDRVEREYLLHHLRRFKGDARALSSFLGYTRKYLYRRLKTLGIRLKEERRRG